MSGVREIIIVGKETDQNVIEDYQVVTVLVPADGVTPLFGLSSTGFMMVYDSVAGDWNRMREGATIGSQLVDMSDRAGRLVGIVYGDAGQLNQTTPADALTPADSLETASFIQIYDVNADDWNRWREGSQIGVPMVEDTGLNTNPERWLHENHWEPAAEVTIALAGAPGEQNVGGGVPAGETRRIREITVLHLGTNNTVVTLLDASGGNIKVSIPVNALSGAQWSSQDGREIAATLQPVVQSTDVTGGNTRVSFSGDEA